MSQATSIPMHLSLAEARALLAASLVGTPLRRERVALADAAGRWLADPLVAGFDLPPQPSSAMDGYAVRFADVAPGPQRLPLAGRTLADGSLPPPLAPAHAWRVTTGAALPEGADTVVIQENVRLDGDAVWIDGPISQGQHVRARGEDFAVGSAVLPAGTAIGTLEMALLASFGMDPVRVAVPPRVAILSTGDELRTPGTPRSGAAVYDSNGPMLATLVRACGGYALPPLRIADDRAALADALRRSAGAADLVISCGGASVGDADHLPAVLGELGHIGFWKLRVKPGMPVLYATVEGTPVLALPGNPVSALITFLLLGRFALRLLAGVDPADPPALSGSLLEPVRKKHTRREYQRCRLEPDGEGRIGVRPGPAQASHHLRGVRDADALVELPEGELDWPIGRIVRVHRLRDWMQP